MAEHGTRARYQRGECRCPECKEANATYQRRYRIANPHTRTHEYNNLVETGWYDDSYGGLLP